MCHRTPPAFCTPRKAALACKPSEPGSQASARYTTPPPPPVRSAPEAVTAKVGEELAGTAAALRARPGIDKPRLGAVAHHSQRKVPT